MDFKARKAKRVHTYKCSAGPEKVFPLLCPVREFDWIPGWECDVIYSESGFNEQGCIFKTQKPYNTETTWVTVTWDVENYIVEFVEFAKDSLIVNLRVSLKPDTDNKAIATWEFTFTAVSETGNAFIEGYTEDKFKLVAGGLEKTMNYYLETGKLFNPKK